MDGAIHTLNDVEYLGGPRVDPHRFAGEVGVIRLEDSGKVG
jgi:hypothetical protein